MKITTVTLPNLISQSVLGTDSTGKIVAGSATAATVATVTALPTTGLVDGQEAFLRVDTAGSYGGPYVWHCKYDSSLSSNKWYVLGPGANLFHRVDAQISTASTTFVDATSGPTITVPVAGIYDVVTDVVIQPSGTSAVTHLVGPNVGGTAPTDAECNIGASTSLTLFSTNRTIRKTAAASAVVKMQHRSTSGASTGFIQNRVMLLRPIRVGG